MKDLLAGPEKLVVKQQQRIENGKIPTDMAHAALNICSERLRALASACQALIAKP